MISHVIELRTSLSKEKLLTYITRFLSTHSFKSRYLIIKILKRVLLDSIIQL